MFRKQLIYRKIALLMSMLMFLSSVGLSFSVGHCNAPSTGSGQAASIDQAFDKAKSCMQLSDDGVRECPPGCCDTEQVVIEGLDYNYVTSSSISLVDQEIEFVHFVVVEVDGGERQALPQVEYLNFRPPLPNQDIPILHQSFLL